MNEITCVFLKCEVRCARGRGNPGRGENWFGLVGNISIGWADLMPKSPFGKQLFIYKNKEFQIE